MNCITILLALLIISTSYYAANARERHPFPPEFYAQKKLDVKTPPSILASHPDDIYWTDVSCKSGGVINYAYKTKVCDGALYVMGEDTDGYGVIGCYTKKDGWRIVCEIYIEGSLSTFSVDGDDIYIGGNFTTAGEKQIPARNIVRYNVKSKEWYALGDGLWNPQIPNEANNVRAITTFKGMVIIQGSFTHSGNKKINDYSVIWDGTDFIENLTLTGKLIIYDNNLYTFGVYRYDTNLVFNFKKTDGHNIDESNPEAITDDRLRERLRSAEGFGIDLQNSLYFIGSYGFKSSADSTAIESGACLLSRYNDSWGVLGGDKGLFETINLNDLVTETDNAGQIYVGGNFREGIGKDLTFKNKSLVMWNGKEWSTLGSGVSRFAAITTITYYDGDVYIGGGSGFSMAGDKPTYGFAKWNKRKVSAVDEQPITSIPEVRLSPNPASDHITVELDNESTDCTISLYDLYGSSVGSYSIAGRQSTINTDHLSSGVYTLRVQYGNRTASKTIAIIK